MAWRSEKATRNSRFYKGLAPNFTDRQEAANTAAALVLYKNKTAPYTLGISRRKSDRFIANGNNIFLGIRFGIFNIKRGAAITALNAYKLEKSVKISVRGFKQTLGVGKIGYYIQAVKL
jgi:hypothetical protein